MAHMKFDLAKLEKLNDPGRFVQLDPVRMWDALGDPTPRVIVEIGAGTGLFAARFAEMAPQATVYAVDIEPVMIEWMTKNRVSVFGERFVPLLAEETSIPLPDSTADLVVTINVHHELANPPATYREALRLLAPAGQILVVDWAPIDTPKGPPQAVRLSGAELAEILSAAGFTDVVVHRPLEWHTLVTGRRPKG
ncbi:MAG: class I SAM-dependent methyltransferase [Coriobacteriia bacterium]|nr:class I SAM-dependent methyltransferase [Coriobacteriia bacterium]